MITSWRTVEALLEQHQSMVFSIALRITGNRELAEEVAQDVFLELHRILSAREAESALRNDSETGALTKGIQTQDHARFWLRKVAVHRAIDAARQTGTSSFVPMKNPRTKTRSSSPIPKATDSSC